MSDKYRKKDKKKDKGCDCCKDKGSSDACFQDLQKILKKLKGQSISVTISDCCETLQGRVLRVDKASITFVGEFGTRIIPICNISSIELCQVLAYVSYAGGAVPENTVAVIDTATDTVITTITVGTSPGGIAFTPDGTTAYVTNQRDDTISVIDTATSSVIDTIPAGDRPILVEFTPDGTRAYISNFFGNTVSVIERESNTVISTIPVGEFPFGIAIGNTPVGTRIYVANSGSLSSGNTVSVIDADPNSLTYNTVIDTITVGIVPIDLAITPDGLSVYVTNAGDNTVSIIDTATNTVKTVIAGIEPSGVGTGNTPFGPRAYVENFVSNTITVFDTRNDTEITTISKGVGIGPGDAAFTPDGRKVYISNFLGNTVSVIDTETNTIIATIPPSGNIAFAIAIGRVCSTLSRGDKCDEE